MPANIRSSDQHREIVQNKESVEVGAIRIKRVVLFDSSGNEVSIGAGSAIADGRKVVATAETAVQLSATSVTCKRVFIQAEETNTGNIVVGGSTVVAKADTTRRGLLLFPSQGEWLNVNNLNLVYIDATVSTDGVTYVYET